MKLVIIGYGPGGASAAIAARTFDPKTEITIITEETLNAHQKPGASLALEFPDTGNLSIGSWSFEALEKRRIKVLSGTKVTEGDIKNQHLKIQESDGTTSAINYDKLLLATGGTPRIPNIPGADLKGIYTIQSMADTSQIGGSLNSINRVILIGAGFSGLETAERLYSLGKEVHLIVRSRLMRRQLEPDMSRELMTRIPKGVIIHQGESPEKVIGSDKAEGIILGGKELLGDIVLFMTGVRPNTSLAESMGVKLGPLGGISVNNTMETSIDGVYAVGDCIEMFDSLTGKPLLLPVGSVAARAGRQAGVSVVGGKKVYGDVALRLQYDHIFGTDVVCIGHSSTTATDVGIETNVHYLEDPAEYLMVALITDKENRLIGGQVISARLGARVAYQILDRVESNAKLDEKPLLKPRHEQVRDLLVRTLGPIKD
jgi:NADPH-dependent 2,4-dienoyl-CoA reductase/sulfur reductase-like enzyme